jgi:hypothetical protein
MVWVLSAPRRRRTDRLVRGWTVGAGMAVGALLLVGTAAQRAAAAGTCSGNQTHQPAPYACDVTRTVDGSSFRVHIAVSGSGTALTTVSLGAPRPEDTPVRVTWHEGVAGPVSGQASAVIAAGQLGPVTMTVDRGSDCGGQLDVKAVFVRSGQSRGRLAGPFVTIPNCTTAATTSTTAPATTSPAVGPSTTNATVAATAATPPSSRAAPPAVLGEQVRPAATGALPVTGRDTSLPAIAGGVSLAFGSLLIWSADRLGRRRAHHTARTIA